MRDQLILFTRFPVAGQTKTRLIPAMGAEAAAALQRRMTEYAVRQARGVSVPIEIRWTGGSETRMQTWLGSDLRYTEQTADNLGHRMAASFRDAFSHGAQRVVIMGTDCPSIRTTTLREAFRALAENDVVLGPACDGGYYLVGLRTFIPELFEGIAWGTDRVLQDSLRKAAGHRVTLLRRLRDVDRPEDIPKTISVIIPTRNEADCISRTVHRVSEGFAVQTCVVDGGSRDSTLEMAVRAGAQVLRTAPGRARQLNAGANASSGELLLFLHADTMLGVDWDLALRDALRTNAVMGAFRFAADMQHPAMVLVEWGTHIRSHFMQLPYGDQGLFMTRDFFERMHGFADVAIMEDYVFVRRARKHGRIVTIDPPAVTSARRWRKRGIWRTTLLNQWMVILYHAGVAPARLARLYQVK